MGAGKGTALLLGTEVHIVLVQLSLHTGALGSGAWQLPPWGNGKQPYPTVASATPHHQNRNITGCIAMESSILLSWDWRSREFCGLP